MNLHEYHAKKIFNSYNLPVSKGFVVKNSNEAEEAIKKLGKKWVLKVQIHSGARGKAGGIKITDNKNEALHFVKTMIGKSLITNQSANIGCKVESILIEDFTLIKKELYFSSVIDRSKNKIVYIASKNGGMDIEKIAECDPNSIIKLEINPTIGANSYQGRYMGFKLGLNPIIIKEFTNIFLNSYKMLIKYDLSLLEINPLAITPYNTLKCIDAKLSIDDNALYRQKEILEFIEKHDNIFNINNSDISYIPIANGNIGCMVNGAGLAMATMDIIKLYGSSPANFLDIGGNADKEKVLKGFKLITSDSNIKGIFINIFGGIVRCDMVAEGIIEAIKEIPIITKMPLVIRLCGTHYLEAVNKLSFIKNKHIVVTDSFEDGAKKIIELTK